MNGAVTFPTVLLALQIVGFGLLTQSVAFPILIGLAAASGFSRRFQFELSGKQSRRLYAVLILMMALKRVIFPGELVGRTENFVLAYADAHALAQSLLILQIIWLFVPGHPRRHLFTPFLAVVVLYLSANYFGRDSDHRLMLAIALIVTPLYGLYRVEWLPSPAKPHLWLRNSLLAGLLGLVLGAGAISSLGLQRYRSDVDRLFAELIFRMNTSSTTGLSDRAMLGNVAMQKTQNAWTVLVRIESGETPGYLRTSAYDLFDGVTWTQGKREDTPLQPEKDSSNPFEGSPGGGATLYSMGGVPVSGKPVQTVYPASGLENRIPVRLDTVRLAALAEGLRMDAMRVVRAHEGRPSEYTLAQGTLPPETAGASYLGLPARLDPRVRALAESILQDARTSSEKIAAVMKYFSGYTYQLGFSAPPGKDRLAYFLLDRPPAHCEYFASGAAVLLRLGGVPCRYVTGLHIDEYNSMGGYWIGRNSDAHAWVEAWDPETGWSIVETTPGGPNDTDTVLGSFGQWYDYLKLRFAKLYAALRAWLAQDLDVGSLLRAIWAAWPVRMSLGALAAAAIAYGIYKRRRRPRSDIELRLWHRLLERMDRSARRHGWTRRPSETLHQFAQRIDDTNPPEDWRRNAARWYRDYAEARYRVPWAAQPLEQLEKDLERLG